MIDLDAIDPNSPTDEELDYLSGGNALLRGSLKRGGGAVRDRIDLMKMHQQRAMQQAPLPTVAHDSDLVPEDPYEETAERDSELDRILDGIDILTAYDRWCGKMKPDPKGRVEGIKISCPIPGHNDADPSAWINTDKQVWVCGPCGMTGGDKYDFAAIAKGFAWPQTYKKDGTFPELRRQMAYDFGYVVRRSPSGEEIVTQIETVYEDDPDNEPDNPTPTEPPPEPPTNGGATVDADSEGADNVEVSAEPPAPAAPVVPTDSSSEASVDSPWAAPSPWDLPDDPADVALEFLDSPPERPEVAEEPALAPVTVLRPNPDVIKAALADEGLNAAAVPWQHIIPTNTFLYEYMQQVCKYDIPHEYHLWLALQAIAFANGFNIRIEDVPPINSNLYVVLVGRTGLGKSRATQPIRTVIREVMPWTGTDALPGNGVKILGGIESGQALIKGIMHEYDDPAAMVPGTKITQPNVCGWTLPEEFAGFVKKAMRTGSDFKERAIEFYDVAREGEVSLNAIKHGGELKVPGPFLQITSTTQPDAIHTYLTSEDTVSGFLNRFIFVMGPSRDERPARWTTAHAPDLARSMDGLRAIVDFCEAHKGLDMTYTPDGDAAWHTLYEKIVTCQEHTGPMSVRLDLILKKLLLLFAINEHKTVIDADLVNRVEPLMGHLLYCYQRVTGDLYWRADDECQNAIIDYITAKNADGMHPRKKEVVDSLKRPIPGRSRFDIGRALDLLEKLEIIQPVKVKPARGPDRIGYKIMGYEAGTEVSS